MNTKSMIRTFAFAGVAVLSTLLAIASNYFTKPARTDGDGDYGRDFNPEFTDAGKATSMLVAAWDDDTATPKKFAVEYKNGWKIPTFHGYPADGKDQLSKAAVSVIGLKRGSLATRNKTDHERFGVIDPLDLEDASTKGRGTRIKLMENEQTLADFIVGKKVEGSEDKVYLRKFGEDKVYKVSAKFDVSTKFSDWAETDLLKASGSDITRLRASRPRKNADDEYEGDDIVEMTREKFGDPWKMSDLDEAAEELKVAEIDAMATTLDDLRLVGVRPRPEFQGKPILNADLKVDLPKQLIANPEIRNQVVKMLRADLGEKGFEVGQDAEGRPQIVSKEGDLSAGTRDGVLYRLTFGGVFSGTEQEIEIGNQSEDDKPDDQSDDKTKQKIAAKQKPAAKAKPEEQKKNRYLIVRVSFDDKLLPPPPTEPTKPIPPPGVEPLADPKDDSDPKQESTDKPDETPKSDKKPAPKSEGAKDSDKPTDAKKDTDEASGAKGEDTVAAKPDDKKDAVPADQPKADDPKKPDEAKPAEPKKDLKDLKAEYFEAIKRYDAEKGRFVGETKAHEAKVAAGQQKVKELNDRFADWYYVISNDSFDKLRLSRADLVKVKEKKPEEKSEGDKKEGDDSAKPATKEEKPGEKKEPEKSEADKKEADKKEPEKPADDK